MVGEALLPGGVEIGAAPDLGAVSRGDEGVVETVAPAGAPEPAVLNDMRVKGPVPGEARGGRSAPPGWPRLPPLAWAG